MHLPDKLLASPTDWDLEELNLILKSINQSINQSRNSGKEEIFKKVIKYFNQSH